MIACVRCDGFMALTSDQFGAYEHCLMCGGSADGATLDPVSIANLNGDDLLTDRENHARAVLREYQREYRQRPEYKAYRQAYQARPEAKAARQAARQRPEAKVKRREYEKDYYQRPGVKARKQASLKQYRQRPEYNSERQAYRRSKHD